MLLILVGVTLSLVAGENGILGRAEKAVDATNIGSGKEQAEILIAEYLSEYYEEAYVNANQSVARQTAEKYIQGQITETGKVTSSGDYFVTVGNDNAITVYRGTSVNESNKVAEGSLVSGGKVEWGSSGGGTTPTTQTWIQTGTTVTDGNGVTLNVGQAVTGYTGNSIGDGNWAVLGAENGKLLITTKSNQGANITLGSNSDITKSQSDYVEGITTLNTAAAEYKDTNMADVARSMKVEDINRVTGYDPENVGLNHDGGKYGAGNSNEYGKANAYSSGTFYVEGSWLSAPQTVTINGYSYYPQTLTTTSGSGTNIAGQAGTDAAYNLIFTNGDGTKTIYWLASQNVVSYSSTVASFGIRNVVSGFVGGSSLCRSNGESYSHSCNLRPVVSLKTEVKVTADGVLSL